MIYETTNNYERLMGYLKSTFHQECMSHPKNIVQHRIHYINVADEKNTTFLIVHFWQISHSKELSTSKSFGETVIVIVIVIEILEHLGRKQTKKAKLKEWSEKVLLIPVKYIKAATKWKLTFHICSIIK